MYVICFIAVKTVCFLVSWYASASVWLNLQNAFCDQFATSFTYKFSIKLLIILKELCIVMTVPQFQSLNDISQLLQYVPLKYVLFTVCLLVHFVMNKCIHHIKKKVIINHSDELLGGWTLLPVFFLLWLFLAIVTLPLW